MSTRYAPKGAPIAFERYMSSPAYAELRGIPGTAVAAKAQLYTDARKRSLLFFLQSLSLKDGGLQRVTQTLLERFPDHSEAELAHFLVEFCINPKLVVQFSDEESPPDQPSSALFYTEIADALRELQTRYEAKIKSDFALTTLGKEVFDT